MKKIFVSFVGPIDRRGHDQNTVVEYSDTLTVEMLLGRLGYPPNQFVAIITVVEGVKAPLGRVLKDGDVVVIYTAASGG